MHWRPRSGLTFATLCLLALTGCGGRLANLPAGFRLKQAITIKPGPKPAVNANGPLLNAVGEEKLKSALSATSFAPLIRKAARLAAKGTIRRHLGGGPLELEITLNGVDAIEPFIGTDWHLRIDATATLRDRPGGKILWQYEHREIKGNELNGRELDELTVDQLVASGGSRLRKELQAHLVTVIGVLLADLQKALDEAAKTPAASLAGAKTPPSGGSSPSVGASQKVEAKPGPAPKERAPASPPPASSPKPSTRQSDAVHAPRPAPPRKKAVPTEAKEVRGDAWASLAAPGVAALVGIGFSKPLGAGSEFLGLGFQLAICSGYQISLSRRQSITPELRFGFSRWGWVEGTNVNGILITGGVSMITIGAGARYDLALGPVLLDGSLHLGYGRLGTSIINQSDPTDRTSDSAGGFAFDSSLGALFMFVPYVGAGFTLGISKTIAGQVSDTDLGGMDFSATLVIRGKLPR